MKTSWEYPFDYLGSTHNIYLPYICKEKYETIIIFTLKKKSYLALLNGRIMWLKSAPQQQTSELLNMQVEDRCLCTSEVFGMLVQV